MGAWGALSYRGARVHDVESPLALYRRYRPETFAEVIGQDHVTEPLRAALAGNRVNHAYLFSGPRGCGKTTSARILARTLNCVQAPVADPCGECDSCRDLATGGPGSLDVIEIDAASHGGVDDARDLREKAHFAPVRDRYKVYIIDEAHMVTTAGFNALLKLVEEPPPHLRFIFATTEPEKVIPTIRSRTHHYPFRLIPPKLLSAHLLDLCQREQVAIEQAAVPLVVRAGAGSARDTLSVLDQLLGGAGEAGVTHQLATDLLGFTPDALLDEVVDAFAARDGAAVFGVVDKVVETGQDPRRFTEDLLRRLRDLVIVMAVPDAPATGLIDVSADAAERLVAQASRFGAHDLSRAADIVAAGLTEMRGATAPRLLLELVCARVLLPGADSTAEGAMVRIERLERRMEMGGAISAHPTAAAAPAPAPTPAPVSRQVPRTEPVSQPMAQPATGQPDSPPPPPPPPPPARVTPPAVTPPPVMPAAVTPVAVAPPAGMSPAVTPPVEEATGGKAAPATGPQGGLGLVDVRRLWPDIIEATKRLKRVPAMILSTNAQVIGVDDKTLTIGFNNSGARESFLASGYDTVLRQAAIDAVGVDWRIEAINDPGAQPDAVAPSGASPSSGSTMQRSPAGQTSGEAPAEAARPDPAPPEFARPDAVRPDAVRPDAVRPEATRPEAMRAEAVQSVPATPVRSVDDDAHPDDPDAETHAMDSEALLTQTLGAKLIEEIKHD